MSRTSIAAVNHLTRVVLFAVIALFTYSNLNAQTTITTENGTNFTGSNGVTGNSAITFVIENTNSFAIQITQIDNYWQKANTGTTPSLWYSSTSLGGAPTIASPDWTLITGPISPITVAANGYYPTFTGMSFTIPAATSYRFALQSTAGIRYSGPTPAPTPTTLSAGGVNLNVYDFSIGATVGYGGAFPSPTNNPRAFTGRITFVPAIACTGTPTAGSVAATDTSVCPSTNFNLSLVGATLASGLSFQWESSANNVNWSPIVGATQSSYLSSQTTDTYYHCIVTCSGQSSTSTSLLVTTNTFVDCYCASAATGAAGADIDNVSIATLNNGVGTPAVSNPASVNLYTDFTSLPATDLMQGISYPISVTQINSGAAITTSYVTVYIDYNHNGTFDLIDETYSIAQTSTANGNIAAGTITVPFTSLTGTTRMRVVLRTGGSATQSACGTYAAGETEDYLVNVLAGTVCTAPPTAGAAVATFTSGCFGLATTISLNGNSVGSGQTYQWQMSTDNATWSNISGATNSSLIILISSTAYYQCIVTCSAQSATSTSVLVSLNSPTLCYCSTGLGGAGCSATDRITAVEIVSTSLNSLSADTCFGTTANTLTPYPASGSTTAILTRGDTYTFNITTLANNIISLWIDYDQDGIFAPNEWTRVCTTSVAGVANTVQVSIPWGIPGGQTGLRIRSRAFGNPNDSTSSCLNFGSGEAEDYVVTIDIGNGITKSTQNQNFTIAPNPAHEYFTISFNGSPSEKNLLKVLNVQGELVYSENISNANGKFSKQLNLKNLAKGIYFVQLISDTFNSTQKLIVE